MKRLTKIFYAGNRSNRPFSYYFWRILTKLKLNSQTLKIKDIEECDDNVVQNLFDKKIFHNYLPKSLNSEEHYTKDLTPKISIYNFNNVYIDIYSSSIIFKKKLLVYRTANEKFDQGYVASHNETEAKIEKKAYRETIEEGFFLGGNGSYNWFHFLVELMPKLTLLNKNLTNVLLVNDIVLKTPSMQKILDIVSDNGFHVKYLTPHKTYFVKKLYHINDFNHVQFNRFDNNVSSSGTFYNPDVTQNFSDLLLEKMDIKEKLPEKIFLYRKHTHRVAKNQDQIVEYLRQFGFVPVCLEELSIEEQAGYFKTAKFIIGITGAAWSNMIFCRNNPKAICFIPQNITQFSAFSNLAKIFAVDFYIQSYENDGDHTNSNFIINFEKFLEIFNHIYEKRQTENNHLQ